MARQRPQPLWTVREVQGLVTIESRVSLEAGLMQEPDAIHRPSQVATPSPGILSIRGGFLASQLGGVMDQQARAGVGGMVTGQGTQSIGDWALFLADILLEGAQFTETVHNHEAWSHEFN